MNLFYFAHNGAEHETPNHALAVIAVTAIATALLVLVVRLLSQPAATKPEKKEK